MSAVLGVGLGALAATGVLTAAAGTPWARRPSLDDRLAPYLRDAPRPSRLLASSQALTPFPTLERLLRPVLHDAMGFVERWVGGIASVRRRLEQLGSSTSVEQFRAEQVIWGAFGLAAALSVAVLQLVAGSGASPVAVLVSAGVLTALGVLGRRLSRAPARSMRAWSRASSSRWPVWRRGGCSEHLPRARPSRVDRPRFGGHGV